MICEKIERLIDYALNNSLIENPRINPMNTSSKFYSDTLTL